MNLSLTRFFEQAPAATLDTCDSEPIHLSGRIQNTGGLLVLGADSQRILGASENIADFLGASADALLGFRLDEAAPDIAEELSSPSNTPKIVHEILDAQRETGGSVYDVVAHAHGQHQFVEFILNEAPLATQARKRMRMCGPACAQIMAAANLDEAMQIACDAVREITGFSRVKIYRFLPDWSGETIAESNDGTLPSYLGLHFPDSDIPKQVRALMTIVPYRFVGRVDDDTVPIRALPEAAGQLDLTWAMSRSVSEMHTAYLRNIGTQASFSCSLIDKGKLWGLIACHATRPSVVPADSWSLAQEIGTALMLKHDQMERTSTANMISRLRRIENEFASELRRSGDVEDVIKTLVPILQAFLRSDGFAFQFGNNLHVSGDVPPEDFIRKLVRWSKANMSDSDQFQTTALHAEFPEAREHIDVACGVLVQPIVMHRVCQLLWFRAPITKRVEWAGRPDAKVLVDPKTKATLGPRTSFDRWVEEHRNQSLPWEEAELEAAREIFKEFLDIITSQLLLKEENSSLRKFAHMAAHDINGSLRGISNALTWMEEDGFEEGSFREHKDLAMSQARKLQQLTESLLEMSLLQEQSPRFREVDLSATAREVNDLVARPLGEVGGRLKVGDLPSCQVVPDLMFRVFLNLVNNAIKYARSDQPMEIEISDGGSTPETVRVLVTDNGPGIEAEFAERVFEPCVRLHPFEHVEGSGFGLAICTEIAKIHRGRISIDTDHASGARFVIELPRKHND